MIRLCAFTRRGKHLVCTHCGRKIATACDTINAACKKQDPCLHLQGQLRLEKCVGCCGDVRIKVYACANPAHGETTIAQCRTCPDYAATDAAG